MQVRSRKLIGSTRSLETRKLAVAALGLFALAAVSVAGQVHNTAAASATAQGSSPTYQGQAVRLRGVNLTTAAAAGVPVYDHIFQILMENTAYSQIIGSSSAPYINSLAATGTNAGNYFALGHPSLPNYMALASGQSYSWAPSDCDPAPGCETSATNIADRIEGAGRTWREYAESMGAACRLTSGGGYYARHNPFVYFTDITGNATRCNSHVVDYGNLATDLRTAATTPSYAFITPNGCDDMHDCSISTGDSWLSRQVPTILASPAFTQQHSLLVIVWDEDNGSQGNKVAFIATGNGVKVGFTSSAAYNHYSWLKTEEASWSLSTMTGNDAAASPMTDIFGSVVTPLTVSASASRASGTAPATISFTGSASGGTAPYSWAWSFGDGTTSTSQSPSHSYAAAGTYSVSLTVTDAASQTATATTLSITISPPLSATAGATPSSGIAPMTVTFTGTPTGGLGPYAFAWAFGDGSTSTAQNPTHTFAAAGTFTAALTITDANGAQASANGPAITVGGPLVATAGATKTAGDAPLTTTLTGSAAGGTSPYSYSWVLGDGATSTQKSPAHTYATAGTYSATLTVSDSGGRTATSSVTIVVSSPLVATATANFTAGDAPLTVPFSGATSGGLAPFTYSWTFGDGTTSSSQNPTHTYTSSGAYTALFTVTDANQVTVSAASLTIIVQPPLTVTDSASAVSGEAPLAVTFSSAPAGGTAPYTYAWTFGDGATATSQSPSHTYTAVGTYAARLTVTDATGRTASPSDLTIHVNPPPTASASAGVSSGDVPLTVTFAGSATNGTAPYLYSWTFGDGGTSTLQNPAHTYTAAGTYRATLVVTDAVGRTASAVTAPITVSPALSATFNASPASGVAPLAVTFNATPAGGLAPYAYAWSFGDGATSTASNPSHTYTMAGSYSALLTVTDANGVKAAAPSLLIVVNGPLAVSASASPSSGDAPAATNFTGSAAGGHGPYTFGWTFGDGASSTQQSPQHTYATAGTYTATLSVTDASGQTASATATVVVSPALGVTSSAAPTVGNAPVTVAFTASPSGGKTPYVYSWAFGDGSTSTQPNPSHAYTVPGTYSSTLTVTDANGVSVTATALAITVHGSLTTAASASPDTGDAPFTTTLTAAPAGGSAPYTYAWSFGDGTTGVGEKPRHSYATAGKYVARLTVTDASGATAPATVTITVNPPPIAAATAGVSAGDAPLTVDFAGAGSGGTVPYTYAWAFGDRATSTAQNPTHIFVAAGTYTVTLTITDSVGVTASATVLTITVSPALTATAGATPASGNAPLAVTLTGAASGGAGPYAFAWTFGDGTTSNLQNPSHTYAAGTFSPVLTVSDANGVKATAAAPAVVSVGPLAAAASASPAMGDAPFVTSFSGSATGGWAPLTYAWDFGDGATSATQNPHHTYSLPGTYTVRETVSDSSYHTALATVTVKVYAAINVTSSVSPTNGVGQVRVSFTSSATGGLAPYAVSWDFGDGTSGAGANVSHSYSAGTFHPRLAVQDSAGGSWSQVVATISVTSSDEANPPAAQPPADQPPQGQPAATAPPSSEAPSTTPAPTNVPTARPAAATEPQPANLGGLVPLAIVIGGGLMAGLAGAVFLAWRRGMGA